MSYMVSIEPVIGADAQECYEWSVTRNARPNQYGKTMDDLLAFDGGFSGLSLQYAPGFGTADTIKEAEAQAKLAIDIEKANIRLKERIASGRRPRKRFLVS